MSTKIEEHPKYIPRGEYYEMRNRLMKRIAHMKMPPKAKEAYLRQFDHEYGKGIVSLIEKATVRTKPSLVAAVTKSAHDTLSIENERNHARGVGNPNKGSVGVVDAQGLTVTGASITARSQSSPMDTSALGDSDDINGQGAAESVASASGAPASKPVPGTSSVARSSVSSSVQGLAKAVVSKNGEQVASLAEVPSQKLAQQHNNAKKSKTGSMLNWLWDSLSEMSVRV